MKATLLTIATLIGLSAHAGEVVRFNSGNLDLRTVQHLLSNSQQDQGIWLIQFKSTVTKENQAALRAAGARAFRYIPDDALVVRGSKQKIETSLGSSLQGVMPFRGAFKLAETLPTVSIFSTGHRDIYSLTVLDKSEVANAVAEMKQIDPEMKVVQQSGRFLDVTFSTTKISLLNRVQSIEYVEPKAEIVPLNIPMDANLGVAAVGDYSDLTGYETGTKVMNFEAAWQSGYTGQGQIVSFADTGLDRGDVSTIAADFQGAVTKGYSVGIGAKNWSDPMGHGTHVAGSVAGRGTASGGKLKGGAFAAQLIPEGMWSPIIDNLTVPPKLNQLFAPAFADGVRVHTNSWGKAADFGAYDSMAVQADEFLFENQGLLVLFAAGNSGVDKDKNGVIDPNSIGTPGTAKNVLTVGASENLNLVGGIQRQVKDLGPAKDSWSAEPIWSSKLSDNSNGIACFSSRGPTKDGRLKPEVVAPGTNILSTYSQEPGANALWGKYNDQYVYSGGTSMATPLVAGAAAVAREFVVKKMGQADPSGALMKVVLMHTAVDLFPGQYGQGSATQELTKRPNNDEGYGRVDMANIVSMGLAGTQLIDNKTGVGTNEQVVLPLTIAAGKSLLANLVYFDAPGSPTAASALVNNLDLILVGADGRQVASRDTKNNSEMIELSNLPAGNYQLIVKGVNVPMGKSGKQPYALAVTVK